MTFNYLDHIFLPPLEVNRPYFWGQLTAIYGGNHFGIYALSRFFLSRLLYVLPARIPVYSRVCHVHKALIMVQNKQCVDRLFSNIRACGRLEALEANASWHPAPSSSNFHVLKTKELRASPT